MSFLTKQRIKIFAVLVGDVMSPRNPYLLIILEGGRVDSGFVSSAIFKELYKIFADEVHLKLIVSDGAAYCLKAGRNLRDLYDSHYILHIRCVAHICHLAFEKVGVKYPDVNSAISSLKQALAKCSAKRRSFPLSMPPSPVITRWGTWIKCALFLSRNFVAIGKWIWELESDGVILSQLREAFNQQNLQTKLGQLAGLERALACQVHLLEKNCSLILFLSYIEQFKEALSEDSEGKAKFTEIIEGGMDSDNFKTKCSFCSLRGHRSTLSDYFRRIRTI